MNYIIDVKGLANGKSSYEFAVDGSFFNMFDSQIVKDAELSLKVDVEKGSGWMGVTCNIVGNVVVECDRCLADLKVPVAISAPFTVKFSDYGVESDSGDNDVILLDKNSAELDLSQIVYDYVCLSIPLKNVHPAGECDPVMMDKMKEILK